MKKLQHIVSLELFLYFPEYLQKFLTNAYKLSCLNLISRKAEIGEFRR